MEPFFFYGTLWTGTASPRMNALVQRYCTPLESGYFRGRLYDTGSYPVAVRSDEDAERIHGMLYELRHPERWLAELDRYESFDPTNATASEYLRTLVPVISETGTTRDAWVYVFNRRTKFLRRIAHGNYSRYLAGRPSPPALT